MHHQQDNCVVAVAKNMHEKTHWMSLGTMVCKLIKIVNVHHCSFLEFTSMLNNKHTSLSVHFSFLFNRVKVALFCI